MKYAFYVKKVSEAMYVVEADDKEKANDLFYTWADNHQEWISDDLDNGSLGWEYSEPEIVSELFPADITKETVNEI